MDEIKLILLNTIQICSGMTNIHPNYDNDFGRNSPLMTRAYQPTAGLTFTFMQTEVNNHKANLWVACRQDRELPSTTKPS